MTGKVYLYLLFVFIESHGLPKGSYNRLSIAETNSYFYKDQMGPGTYAFAYYVEDPDTGNVQFREEEKYANGTVAGSYGYLNANGKPVVATYTSDSRGYRVEIKTGGDIPHRQPKPDTFTERIFLKNYI